MPTLLRSPFIAFSAWLLSAAVAHAATVAPESGEVLVSGGTGFVKLHAPVELAPGGQLLVRQGGSAVITYANGCSLRVGPDRVWVIQYKPPCEAGRSIDMTGRMSNGSLKDEPAPPPPADYSWLIPAGLVVGGVVTCAVLCFDDDDDRRLIAVSP